MLGITAKNGLWAWTTGLTLAVSCCSAAAAETTARVPLVSAAWNDDGAWKPPGQESWTEKIGSSFRRGIDQVSGIFTPEPPVPDVPDPTKLSTPAKPNAQTHLAMARLCEETGKPTDAAWHYEQALRRDGDRLDVMLAYARMLDRQNDFDAARTLYERAAKAHPQSALVFNDLALCLAKRGKLTEAVATLMRAVQLDPANARYRANLALVLVDMNRPHEALEHLRAVSPEAVAHYNLGYLLQQKGRRDEALGQFRLALQKDPTLVPAQRWLARLGTSTPSATPPAGLALPAPSAVPFPVSSSPMPPQAQPGFAGLTQQGPSATSVWASDATGGTARTAARPTYGATPARSEHMPPATPGFPAVGSSRILPPGQPSFDARAASPYAPLPPAETHIPNVRPLPPIGQ